MNDKKLTCIDDTISEGDARVRAYHYVNGIMWKNEEDLFEKHMKDCSYCGLQALTEYEKAKLK